MAHSHQILEERSEMGWVYRRYIFGDQDFPSLTVKQIKRRSSLGRWMVVAAMFLSILVASVDAHDDIVSNNGLVLLVVALVTLMVGAHLDIKYRVMTCYKCNKKFQKGDEVEEKYSTVKGWHSSNWHKICPS